MIRRCLALLAAAFVFFAAIPVRGEEHMTVLIYMAGADLESAAGAASEDIDEMTAAVRENGGIDVILMTGGAERWHNGLDPSQNVLSRVTPRGLEPLCAWDGASMGDPDTLGAFLDYAVESCPADQYALIIWSHGGGPLEGVCFDARYRSGGRMDALTLDEMTRALRNSAFAERKLAFLGFDACLMATAEVAAAAAPYAEAMIASQETVSPAGWDYAFLGALRPGDSGIEAGRRAVEAYAAADDDPLYWKTLSCLDLTGWENAAGEMAAVFSALRGELDEDIFREISLCRESAAALGTSSEEETDLTDLMDFLDQLEEAGLIDAGPLRRALEELVVISFADSPCACGLSLYFPCYNRYLYSRSWGAAYEGLDFVPEARDFIADYAALWLPPAVDWDDPDAVESLADFNYQSVGMPCGEENGIVSARAVIVEETGSIRRQIYTPGAVIVADEETFFGYNGEALYALNGAGRVLAGPVSYRTEDGVLIVSVALPDGGNIRETRWLPDDDGNYACAEALPEAFAFASGACPPEDAALFDNRIPAGFVYSASIAADEAEGLCLRFLPYWGATDRTAVFEAAYADGQRSVEAPVEMYQPARLFLTEAPQDRQWGDMTVTLADAVMYTQWDAGLELVFDCVNEGPEEAVLRPDGLMIDGTPLPEELYRGELSLLPGEPINWDCFIPGEVLTALGLGQAHTLTLTAAVFPEGGEEAAVRCVYDFPCHLGMATGMR